MFLEHNKPALVVGDVHGCSLELEDLLAKANFDPQDRQLIFVGDLIHKGPDSVGVLEIAKRYDAKIVLGNHELAFLKYVRKPAKHKGFNQILKQMGNSASKWIAYLRQWPLFLETPDWLVVHAGLVPGQHPSESKSYLLVNMRTWDGKGDILENDEDPAWFDLYHGEKLVIFGHWARRGLVWQNRVIGLDSGCVYGNQLSAVTLPERQLIQVQAREVYCPIK
jgi:bis(5'-nucleosyl)-tetraphosphatase (symmetrical)